MFKVTSSFCTDINCALIGPKENNRSTKNALIILLFTRAFTSGKFMLASEEQSYRNPFYMKLLLICQEVTCLPILQNVTNTNWNVLLSNGTVMSRLSVSYNFVI